MTKNVLLTNGKFYTKESVFTGSLFCCDGIIEAIVNEIESEKYKEKADEIIDLKGRFGYPDFSGFIEEIEYDCTDGGDEMLNIYDKKMTKKVLNEEIDMYLEKGSKANIALYDMDLIKNTDIQKSPPVRALIVNGQLFYDEDEYAEEQYFWLMSAQQF